MTFIIVQLFADPEDTKDILPVTIYLDRGDQYNFQLSVTLQLQDSSMCYTKYELKFHTTKL